MAADHADGEGFAGNDNVPAYQDALAGGPREGERHAEEEHGGGEEHAHVRGHGDVRFLVLTQQEESDAVLEGEDEATGHEDEGEGLEGLDGVLSVLVGFPVGVVAGAGDGEAGHYAELEEFAHALEGGVVAEADVEEGVLQPGEPDDGKVPEVRCEVC